MTIIENLKAIRTRLTKATTSVVGDVQALRSQISEKRAELKRVRLAPPPLADVETRVRLLVARTAEGWLANEGRLMFSRIGIEGRAAWPWTSKEGEVPWAVRCAADPEGAVNFVLKLVSRIEYTPGPALADRPALIAKIEADLADLEEGEERLVDEACAVGLTIEHRPEVVTRRQNERRKAELDAKAVANRAARQAAIDEAHRSRTGRTGRSSYLAANAQP